MLIAVFFAGLRHGFDLDHIAAITDITSSQTNRRRAVLYGTVYAIGHALVLTILCGLAVIAGQKIPESFDETMGRIIGATLVLLGIYVVYTLIRFGQEARLRSRWMLILSGLKRTVAWLRRTPVREVEISHTHEHDAAGHHHHEDPRLMSRHPETGELSAVKTRTHSHAHSHVLPAPSDPFTEYGIATSFGIGMIHGVGAETPSQVVLFTSAAGVSSTLGGAAVLISFVVGLFIGNSILVGVSAVGFGSGKRLPGVYLVLASVTAIVSIAVGLSYLT